MSQHAAALAFAGGVGLGLEPGIVWPLALIGFGIAVLWLRANDAAAPTAAPPWSAASGAATGSEALATADPTAPSAPWVAPQNLTPTEAVISAIAVMLVAVIVGINRHASSTRS
jgi:hypothetical protein